jgi:hypothetical protein
MDDALAARGRREGEANTRRKQEAVGEYYNRARQMKPPPLLPSLATFRRMPLPVSLQRFDGTAAKLEEELGDKHSVTARLLDDALTRWRAEVRKALTAKLRVPYHPLPSPRHGLLAVDRVNARFVCTKCKSVAPRYADDGCLVRPFPRAQASSAQPGPAGPHGRLLARVSPAESEEARETDLGRAAVRARRTRDQGARSGAYAVRA